MDMQDLMSGREQAKARDKWLESDEGKKCLAGTATGQYLENRLHLAFIAGMQAGLSHVAKRMQMKVKAQS